MVPLAQPPGQGQGRLSGAQAAAVRHRMTGGDPLEGLCPARRIGRCRPRRGDHQAGQGAVQGGAGGGEQAVGGLAQGQHHLPTGEGPVPQGREMGGQGDGGRHGGQGPVQQGAQAADGLDLGRGRQGQRRRLPLARV